MRSCRADSLSVNFANQTRQPIGQCDRVSAADFRFRRADRSVTHYRDDLIRNPSPDCCLPPIHCPDDSAVSGVTTVTYVTGTGWRNTR
jgi:hypothetical protein